MPIVIVKLVSKLNFKTQSQFIRITPKNLVPRTFYHKRFFSSILLPDIFLTNKLTTSIRFFSSVNKFMFISCNMISKRFIAKTTFTSNIRLNRHIVSVHEGKKPFKCDIRDEENKPFKSNSCGASFARHI